MRRASQVSPSAIGPCIGAEPNGSCGGVTGKGWGGVVEKTEGFTPSPPPSKVQLHTSLRTSAQTYRTHALWHHFPSLCDRSDIATTDACTHPRQGCKKPQRVDRGCQSWDCQSACQTWPRSDVESAQLNFRRCSAHRMYVQRVSSSNGRKDWAAQ